MLAPPVDGLSPGDFDLTTRTRTYECMCLLDNRLTDSQKNAFNDLCRVLEAIFHYEFHRVLENLKNCYAPFNPDADTRPIKVLSREERQHHQVVSMSNHVAPQSSLLTDPGRGSKLGADMSKNRSDSRLPS